MTEEVKDGLIALSTGQQASAELPLVEVLLVKLNREVDTRIYSIYERGDLTPELALQGWIEKFAYRQLVRRLTQRVVMGQTAGEDLAPHMEMRK